MDISGLFGKVKEMQEKIQESQERVKKLQAEGEAGGGMVRALVSGERRVISIIPANTTHC